MIREIWGIARDSDDRWVELGRYGLTGASLELKLSELFDWLTNGKIRNFIKGLNSILASLFKVFAQLEPVKEFKDFLEIRLEDENGLMDDPGFGDLLNDRP